MKYDVIIIGGGAAGFFTAINLAETARHLNILILERGKEVLTKVRVSGGGRCNVTHADFLPKSLSTNYPRGERELLGPFHQFMTGDTMAWFEERGVSLKIEDDGRIFPVTDSSQTIIDCFLNEAKKYNVTIKTGEAVNELFKVNKDWQLKTKNTVFTTDKVVIATGSNPKIWNLLATLGHSVINAIPSLFTFNIDDNRIKDLPGLATEAFVELLDENGNILKSNKGERADRGGVSGALLITHWGMSGPAILKLSAWGARELHGLEYKFSIKVNWLPDLTVDVIYDKLLQLKLQFAKQMAHTNSQFDLPKRLWQSILLASEIESQTRWADLNKEQMQQIVFHLNASVFRVDGKSTFKEEFVTAGGINLREVNFKTFESKIQPGLYFAGEVLNIDAVTGGFNFQNAWTGGFIAAKAIADAVN
ncbi:MAG: NAD(P)/FAD-dependent oxidoreductase [Leeuwenhoekiella sp.]